MIFTAKFWTWLRDVLKPTAAPQHCTYPKCVCFIECAQPDKYTPAAMRSDTGQ